MYIFFFTFLLLLLSLRDLNKLHDRQSANRHEMLKIIHISTKDYRVGLGPN